jgi:hypothetical protein
MATGKEVYQQLITDANEAFQYAEEVLQKAREGRNPNGTYIAKTAKPRAVRAAEKQVAKAEAAILAAYKTANDYDTKQKAKAERAAERAAERERAKAERAAERERAKTEKNRLNTPSSEIQTPNSEVDEIEVSGGERKGAATSENKSVLLEALKSRRAELGSDTELETVVLGSEENVGLRDIAQKFINENPSLFDAEKLSGLTARELIQQAVTLSEDALEATDSRTASVYLVRLKSILKIAKSAKGSIADATAEQIESLLTPVTKVLEKKTTFQARIKENVRDYLITLPERLLANIPVVGGLLSETAKRKREQKESEEQYLGALGKRISRRASGNISGYLDFPGQFAKRTKQTATSVSKTLDPSKSVIPFPRTAQYAEQTIPSSIPNTAPTYAALPSEIGDTPVTSETTPLLSVLKQILETMRGGRGSIVAESTSAGASIGELGGQEYGSQAESPTESLNNISAAIGNRGTTKDGTVLGYLKKLIEVKMGVGGEESSGSLSFLSDLLPSFGRRSRIGRLFRKGRILAKRMASKLRGSRIGRMTRSAFGAARGLGSRALGAARGLGSRALGAVRGLGSRALGTVRGLGGSPAVSSAAKASGGFFSSIGKGISSAFGSVAETAAKLNPIKAAADAVKSGAGKIVKAIVSIPGLGAAISTGIGVMDIMNIKNDKSLTPEEKKEAIGKSLVGTLGSALGSVGGGALGTLIPVPVLGTVLGSMGGALAGEWLAGQLAESIGGRGIYDLVESIPGIGSAISVDPQSEGINPQPQENGVEGTIQGSNTDTYSSQNTSSSTVTEGKLVSTVTNPQSEVGKQVAATAGARNELSEVASQSAQSQGGAVLNANSTSNTNISNITNNFNDDLRLRNNEPTLRNFQVGSIMPV